MTIHNVSAAEAMVLGIKAGLEPVVYDTLADSAGTSRIFQVRGPLMRDPTYDSPTATIRTHLKDLSIIGAFANELNAPPPCSPPPPSPITPARRRAARRRTRRQSAPCWRHWRGCRCGEG